MYRVELKVRLFVYILTKKVKKVPNVPCGVERKKTKSQKTLTTFVPNVPCGVERKIFLIPYSLRQFLMYRVELKETKHQNIGRVRFGS